MLKKKGKLWKRIFLTTFFVFIVITIVGAADFQLWEGFEGKNDWSAASSWTDTTATMTINKNNMQGEKAILISFDGSKGYHTAAIEKKINNADWTPYKAVKMDIYNETINTIRFKFVIRTAVDNWQETAEKAIHPGMNQDVIFDLTKLSSEKTGWSLTSPRGIDDVESVYLYFQHEGLSGKVYVDNIRLTEDSISNIIELNSASTFNNDLKFDIALKNEIEVILGDGADLAAAINADVEDFRLSDSLETLETTSFKWAHGGGWTDATVISQDNLHVTEGSYSGVLYFDSSLGYGQAIATKDYVSKGNSKDLSSYTKVKVDFYNPLPTSVKTKLVFETTLDGWQESEEKVLDPGWNKDVAFSLAKVWAGTYSWSSGAPLGFDQVNKMHIRVAGYSGSNKLYFDNIRFGKPAELPTAAINGDLSLTLSYNPVNNISSEVELGSKLFNGSMEQIELRRANIKFGNNMETRVFYKEKIAELDDIIGLIDEDQISDNYFGIDTKGDLKGRESFSEDLNKIIDGLHLRAMLANKLNQDSSLGNEDIFGLRFVRPVNQYLTMGFGLLNKYWGYHTADTNNDGWQGVTEADAIISVNQNIIIKAGFARTSGSHHIDNGDALKVESKLNVKKADIKASYHYYGQDFMADFADSSWQKNSIIRDLELKYPLRRDLTMIGTFNQYYKLSDSYQEDSLKLEAEYQPISMVELNSWVKLIRYQEEDYSRNYFAKIKVNPLNQLDLFGQVKLDDSDNHNLYLGMKYDFGPSILELTYGEEDNINTVKLYRIKLTTEF